MLIMQPDWVVNSNYSKLVGGIPDTVQCNIVNANHAASLCLILTQLMGGTPDTVQCNIMSIPIMQPVCT